MTDYHYLKKYGMSIDNFSLNITLDSMKEENLKIRQDLLYEITNSNMTFQRKMKLMRMLDNAFRKYLGVNYLSNEELNTNDLLNRLK